MNLLNGFEMVKLNCLKIYLVNLLNSFDISILKILITIFEFLNIIQNVCAPGAQAN